MFYPSIEMKETNIRHIVKDQNYCECGFKYNVFFTVTRKDMKRIQFKPFRDITCPKCRSIIK
jgi:hypothetical protein